MERNPSRRRRTRQARPSPISSRKSGGTWKTYQESLPPHGADGVNYSDGVYTNNTNFANVGPAATPLTSASLVFLYAAKHNPFVYFSSIQEGTQPGSGLTNVVGYDGPRGLYADLARATFPSSRSSFPTSATISTDAATPATIAAFDPNDNGTLVGLNPALMQRGDVALNTLVTSIKSSPVWKAGNNAIVVVWDEDDYSVSPTVNKVLADRRHQLRIPWHPEHRGLQSLLAAEVDRGRPWLSLPESCLRQ